MNGRDDGDNAPTAREGAAPATLSGALLAFRPFAWLLVLALALAGLGHPGFGERPARAQAPRAGETLVFGPKTYARAAGKPAPVTDGFGVADPAAEFTLVVQNGQNGAGRASSAVVLLNGQLVLGPSDFNPQVDLLRKAVVVQAQNALSVEVRGQPGAFLTVSVAGTHLNAPPVARAGEDFTARVGERVELDGSGSSDADGDPLTFRWQLVARPPGSAAALSDPAAIRPGFTLDVPGAYTARLTVNDGREDGAPDTVTVSTANSPPVADAGPDQRLALGATATLDGGGSSDPDGDPLSYRWTLDTAPAGSAAALADATGRAPSLTADKAGTYIVALTVSDGALDSEPDYVTLTTLNTAPVADAGPDQTAVKGATVVLDGSTSRDADGDPLTYRWSLAARPDGSAAGLSVTDPIKPTFVPDLAGEYVAQLIVNDGALDSEPDTAAVTATDPAPTNRAPTITSAPVTQATAGQLYRYDVEATDPDAGDALAYSLPTRPDGMTVDAASGLIEWTPATAGGTNVAVRVTDRGGLFAEQSFTVTVAAATANQAPQVTASANPATVTLPTNGVTLDGTVTDDGLPDPPAKVTALWTKDSGPGSVTFGDAGKEDTAATFSAAGTYALRLTASDGDKSAFATVTVTVNPEVLPPLPPDPGTVAPQVDPTVATTAHAATQFLYTGANPIQTGVAPGTIEPKRAAVIRGRVLDKQNNPLPAVVVTVLNHPEFGQTLSRADGGFDMAVNGGGHLTLNYRRDGYLPAQRQANVPWQDFVVLDEVALIPRDAQATVIDLAKDALQVAQGSVSSDADGTRQATLLISPGTTAQVYNPDGSLRPVTALTLRATEYTVGPNGPRTMPAPLPPTSGYTYAVELSADEATVKKDGQDVIFNQPVSFYVDNFLNFPVGGEVPVGYYDNTKGAWTPYDNGRIVEILGVIGGLAQLDVTGSGQPADAAALVALGVTDAERAQLATQFPVGKSLWRMRLTHLSTWDCNWPFGPPPDAEPPQPPVEPENGDEHDPDDPDCAEGSIIECETQTLGERIPLVGTGLSLHYRSSRVPGRLSARTLSVPLSGPSVPASLKRIEAQVEIAGRRISLGSFSARPNQTATYTWDGRDGYGRPVQGVQPVRVELGYVYDGVYRTPEMGRGFARPGGVAITGSPARQEVTLWQTTTTAVGAMDFRASGAVGAWTLDVHHTYDPAAKVLYRGDGTRQKPSRVFGQAITTVAGSGLAGNSGDGGPAAQARLRFPDKVAVAPDGSVLIADTGNHRIRRVGPDGRITTFAGTGSQGYGGDGGPATQALLISFGVAVAPDGSVLIADAGNHRIRRVGPDGIITTFAGTGVSGYGGDGGPAAQARLSSPLGVAVAPDGSVLIADADNQRIRRVGPDGLITTLAGSGVSGYGGGYSGDGGPATQALLNSPREVAVVPDGSVLIADVGNHRIRRVGPDGTITTFAGMGAEEYGGDGGPAAQARLSSPRGVAVAPDGSVLIADAGNHRIRRVGPNGLITTLAGSGVPGYGGDGGPAAQAQLQRPYGVTVAPDGSVLIADTGNHRIRRVASDLPGFSATDLAITSEDGRLLYRFNPDGRHLSTVDTLTKTVLYSFGYDSAGRLSTITDGDGDATTIERDGNGHPTALVAPFGQRTALSVDGHGALARVVNPAGEAYEMAYTADGLLTAFTDPKGHAAQFTYDALGRLQRDANAAGGSQTLARVEQPGGYTVTRTSALNRSTVYRLDDLPGGERLRAVRGPDGLETQTRLGADGSARITAPDGSVTESLDGPDPRFGMQSPITTRSTVTTGGLTATASSAATVTPANPTDPLTFTTLTRTATLNGRTATSVYTQASRTAVTTSPAGRTSTTVMDAQGRLAEARVPGLATVAISRDGRGRPIRLSQTDGAETRALSFGYGPHGFLQTVTDPLGRAVNYDHDLAGRVTRQTLPDGREIRYQYDANGNLASLTPPGRPAHVFTYTPVDLTADYTPPAAGLGTPQTSYQYNPDRQLTRITRPDGQTLSLDYDSAGRPSALTIPTGSHSYGYNGVGKLAQITAPDSTLTYGYSGALPVQTTWSGGIGGSVGFGYDNDFRVREIAVNGQNPVAYQYDPDSLLVRAGDLALSRDAQNGLPTGSTLGAVTDRLTRNGFGEVATYSAAHSGTNLLDLAYTRDALGRITQKVETIQGQATTHAYTYDLADRLVEVKRDGATVAAYGYDANGNRIQVNGATVATVDEQDRLLTHAGASYTHTANGELKTKTQNGQTTRYDYDVLGNLRQVALPNGSTIDYLIDGQNRRIGKKINGVLTQSFLYQSALQVVAEMDGNHQIVSRFVYAGGNAPEYLIKGGQTYRLIKDHLGSPRLVVNTTDGTIAQRLDYDVWGRVLLDSNPGFQPFGFAGGLYDRDTGLVRFGARDYDPETGRWTAKDPILFAGGDANLYGYVQNDPVNWVDPYGLECQELQPLITTPLDPIEEMEPGLEPVCVECVILPLLRAPKLLSLIFQAAKSEGNKIPNCELCAPPNKRGNAPIGKDGHPVELHHRNQNPNGPLDEMTRTDHRLGDNFKKNHGNTGQEASNIDRGEWRTEQKNYWKKEWDSGRFDGM